MKKLLLACISVAAAVAAHGQGTIVFANDVNTRFTTNGTAVGQGTGQYSGANTYRIGLYTAAPGTTTESLFTLIAVATNNPGTVSFQRGLFSYPESPLVVNGNNGTPIAFQVRAWSLAGGASYEAALANALSGQPGGSSYYYGAKSPIGQLTPGVAGAPSPSVFGDGSTPGQLTSGLALVPLVPEPSSIALGLLGLGAIALFRRRK